MAFYGKIDQLYGILASDVRSNPTQTLGDYLLNNPNGQGHVLINYLIGAGVPSTLRIDLLISRSEYFNRVDKAIKVSIQTKSLNDEITITNQYGEGYATFSSAISISHANFRDLMMNEQLEIGVYYRINDYRSVNFINGSELADWYMFGDECVNSIGVCNPTELYYGEVEPIVVRAVSKSKISSQAYSELYPQDIIEYNPLVNSIGTSLHWQHAIQNGNDLPSLDGYNLENCFDNFTYNVTSFDLQWDGTNVYFDMPEGYPIQFGHGLAIYIEFNHDSYRLDDVFKSVVFGESLPTTVNGQTSSKIRVTNDGMRVYLLDLHDYDYNQYDVNTLYLESVFVIGEAYGWVNRRTDTSINVSTPFDWRNRMYNRYTFDLGDYDSDMFYSNDYAIGSYGDSFYIDGNNNSGSDTLYSFGSKSFPVFPQGYDLFNVKWDGIGGPDFWWGFGASDNNVFFSDVINSNFEPTTIGNTFLGDCEDNNFSVETTYNVFGDMYHNTFGANMYNNILSIYGNAHDNNFNKSGISNNIIPGDFYNNTIGSYFTDNYHFFQPNECCGTSFNNCVIGNDFYNNTLYKNFYRNTFGNECTYNDFYYRVEYNTVGDQFRDNTIDGEMKHNKIGNHFRDNYWDFTFQFNTYENASWYNWDSWNCWAAQLGDNTHTRIFLAEESTWKLDYVTLDGSWYHNIIDVNLGC